MLLVELPVGVKDVTELFAAEYGIDDLSELVEQVRRRKRLDELSRRGLLSPREIVETVDGGFASFMNPPKGLLTGFCELDRLTHGLHAGESVILAGRPSMGKTSLSLDIAQHAASQRKTVAIFSYEMSRQSLLTRLICGRARVDQMRFRERRLSPEERRRINQALNDLACMPIRIDDTPLPLHGIEARLKRLQSECGLGLVIVDYLQLVPGGGQQNRTQEVGALSRGLKLMAAKFGVPFIVLSQLSRAPENRTNQRPQLSDLRDSGNIEQDADLVCFLFREEVYKPDREDLRGIAELIVTKHRNGPTGRIRLAFIKEFTRFEDYA